jgi:hypothetical protein
LLIIQFFSVCFLFLRGGGQSVQGAMLVYPRGGCEDTACHLFAYMLVCMSQAGQELVPGSTGALLVSPCIVVWGRYAWAGSLEVSEFCRFLVVFPAKCVSSVSARFLL